ncbi:hypothetical protein ILYODFUR_013676 [Ilyodon furcidens]|uniref:Uncharacterized protein n=1 Tax=Ilyodon furcidens TaxID=33524 RepID=A0ABV0T7T6_9TELE
MLCLVYYQSNWKRKLQVVLQSQTDVLILHLSCNNDTGRVRERHRNERPLASSHTDDCFIVKRDLQNQKEATCKGT